MRPCPVASVARTNNDVFRQASSRRIREPRNADRQRYSRRRQRNARVGEHDAAHALSMLECPAESDRPAPVVRREDDRAVDRERVEDASEIVDSLRERPRAGALRKPHRDLIDREHAVPVAEAPMERAPEKRPGRVAVHADDRQRRLALRRPDIEGVDPNRARRARPGRRTLRDQAGSIPRRSRRPASNAAGADLTR